MIPSEEDVDEEYELTADDIPQFVQKFEVPKDSSEEEETIEQKKIELVQPNSETPTFVQPLPPSEIIEAEESGMPLPDQPQLESGDFDGDGKIDEFEAAFSTESTQAENSSVIPPAPSFPIPKIDSLPVEKETVEPLPEKITLLPSAPDFPQHEKSSEPNASFEENPTFGLGSNKKNGPQQK